MRLIDGSRASLRRVKNSTITNGISLIDSAGSYFSKLSVSSSPQNNPRYRFIIAIDFGTTYCSVGYICVPFAEKPIFEKISLEPRAIKRFPRGRSLYEQYQVPTVYIAHKDGFLWGYSATKSLNDPNQKYREAVTLELVKLLLFKNPETEGLRRELLAKLKVHNLDITQVIANILDGLWLNTCEELKDDVRFEAAPITLLLSMPACSDQASVRLMEDAVKRTRLPREYKIVSEPEAAAALLLHEHKDEIGLDRGDTFLVVDLGGGTGDTIALTVVQLDPFVVDEAAPSKGSMCGARFVLRNFEAWFRAELELDRKKYLTGNWEEVKQSLVDLALISFEPIMRDFTEEDEEARYIPIHGLKPNRKSFGNGKVRITSELLRSFFDPVIDQKIIPLIEDEIRAAHDRANIPLDSQFIKCILLVGGFSGSDYLRKKIINFFQTPGEGQEIPYNIKVQTSQAEPSTTVACGSILLHLKSGFVRQRLLRSSYGFSWDEVYNPKSPRPDALVELDAHENDLRIRNCIKWIIKAGDNVPNEWITEESEGMHWTVDENFDFKNADSGSELFCELFLSDSNSPTDGETLEEMQKRKQHVELWGVLTADTTRADVSRLVPKEADNGNKYYKIPYGLRFKWNGLETEWELVVPDLPGVRSEARKKNIRAAVPFQAEAHADQRSERN